MATIRRITRQPYIPNKNQPMQEPVKLETDVLTTYLRQVEDSSDNQERFYTIRHLSDDDELEGVFFAAKTPCGAVLKIFRYMQDEEIPLWMGPMMNHCSIDIMDLLKEDPVSDLDRFKEICHEWIDEHTMTTSKVILA